MTVLMTWSEAMAHRMERQLSGGGTAFTTPYFGASPVFPKDSATDIRKGSPQAFLVEQNPGSIVAPHFHLEDQFQLVIRGNGTLGRHGIGAISVHYANAHNGYGPIVAGDEGLAYFTLRARGDNGAWYLPDASAAMNRSARRRQATGGPAAPLSGESRIETLLAEGTDGLGAWCITAPANGTAASTAGTCGNARFIVLADGEISIEGATLDPLAVAYLEKDETPAIEVGPAGARFLILQFPSAQVPRVH